jgi:hypothetical protein
VIQSLVFDSSHGFMLNKWLDQCAIAKCGAEKALNDLILPSYNVNQINPLCDGRKPFEQAPNAAKVDHSLEVFAGY